MELFKEVRKFDKEELFNLYSSMVLEFDEYEQISKTKMIKEIYNVYSKDFQSLFTTRELKYLSLYKDNELPFEDKYFWELKQLIDKEIVYQDDEKILLYDESKVLVFDMLKNIDWEKAKKADYINEATIGYLKISCDAVMISFINVMSVLLNVSEEKIKKHIDNNLCFRFYTYRFLEDIPSLGRDMDMIMYQCYFPIYEHVFEARVDKAITANFPSVETMRTVFYNDFDINNKKVDEFCAYLREIFINYTIFYCLANYAVMVNDKDYFINALDELKVPDKYKNKIVKLWNKAFDEMPSAALNCLTPKENDECINRKSKTEDRIERDYYPQENANLCEEDCDLFYKVYFGVLEYTNRKYKVKPKLKIYNAKKVDPSEAVHVAVKFYEKKDVIVDEFCKENPFKFNSEELDIVKGFKRGLRDHFLFTKFEKEYTVLLTDNYAYMVKGLVSNLDEIFSYQELPMFVDTTILPFKDKIVVDGMYSYFAVKLGSNIANDSLNKYKKLKKVYKL